MSGTTYPSTPPGWTPVESRSIGPFTTHVTFRQADGTTVGWSSRSHRKHASLLSRVRRRRENVHEAARHASWWIGILFAVGSLCFLFAPMPWFFDPVGATTDAVVFFVGSLFFTSAAALQWLETINADPGPGDRAGRLKLVTFEPRRIDWWSSGVQLVGTVFFNFTTFRALQTSVESARMTSWCGARTLSARSASSSRGTSRMSRSPGTCGRGRSEPSNRGSSR